jgi:hypothetical protein
MDLKGAQGMVRVGKVSPLWKVMLESCAPSSPVASRGCMALAPHLLMVVWPCKFWPHLSEKYDGMVNPTEFL